MKKYLLLTIALVTLVLVEVSGQSLLSESSVDVMAQKYIKKAKNAGLIIGIYQQGQFRFFPYGEWPGAVAPEERLMQLGAATSVYTATLLGFAMAEGRVHSWDPLQRFLPDSIQAPRYDPALLGVDMAEDRLSCDPDPLSPPEAITLCQLAQHTSGLTCSCTEGYLWHPLVGLSGKEKQPPYDPDESFFWASLSSMEVTFPPGTKYRYSNQGMAVLGQVLSRLYNTSYGALIDRYLGKPLGLQDTRVKLTSGQRERIQPGFDTKGRPVAPWEFTASVGAAGLWSTPADVLHFLAAHLGTRTALVNDVREVVTAPVVDFTFPGWRRPTQGAYGWLVSRLQEDDPRQIHWINGGTGGYRVFMAFVRQNQLGLVVMANSEYDVDELGWGTLELMLGSN